MQWVIHGLGSVFGWSVFLGIPVVCACEFYVLEPVGVSEIRGVFFGWHMDYEETLLQSAMGPRLFVQLMV